MQLDLLVVGCGAGIRWGIALVRNRIPHVFCHRVTTPTVSVHQDNEHVFLGTMHGAADRQAHRRQSDIATAVAHKTQTGYEVAHVAALDDRRDLMDVPKGAALTALTAANANVHAAQDKDFSQTPKSATSSMNLMPSTGKRASVSTSSAPGETDLREPAR